MPLLGRHNTPLQQTAGGLLITLAAEPASGLWLYQRQNHAQRIVRRLGTDPQQCWIVPVKPVHLPKPIAQHLQIELSEILQLAPRSVWNGYLTCPLEIAIYLGGRHQLTGSTPLDLFSLSRAKYTLYGDQQSGLLCKYWRSPLLEDIPSEPVIEQGYVALQLRNDTARWVPVSRIVLPADTMKLYYRNDQVIVPARMELLDERHAEISYPERLALPDFKPVPEAIPTRKIHGFSGKFLMEAGI